MGNSNSQPDVHVRIGCGGTGGTFGSKGGNGFAVIPDGVDYTKLFKLTKNSTVRIGCGGNGKVFGDGGAGRVIVYGKYPEFNQSQYIIGQNGRDGIRSRGGSSCVEYR